MIQLREAKIFELPLFLSMLKTLKVRPTDRHAFDTANMNFVIQGETIDFKKLEFLGDAVSLLGNGKMNLDWDIDLNLYSIIGRNRINIPLISELYRAGSQKALWINVTGKLDNPKTNRHVLPQLNDSLQQIFQPQQSFAGQGSSFASRLGDQIIGSTDFSSNSQWPTGSQGITFSQTTTGATNRTPIFRSPSPGTWFESPAAREASTNVSNTYFR